MKNNILKVYDEDLIHGAINASSVASSKVLEAGSTMGALCVNVFAEGEVSLASDLTIEVKDGASENGAFASCASLQIAATKTFSDGELMASLVLPQDVKDYVMATAVSATNNTGAIRVTLGYLAR